MRADGTETATALPDWKPPADVDRALIAEAAAAVPAIEAYLDPATPEQIGATVTILLSHFFVAGMDATAQIGVMRDWLVDLSPYPLWSIEMAAREWRRTHDRRPPIAALIRECEFWVSPSRAELALLKRLIAAQPAPATDTRH